MTVQLNLHPIQARTKGEIKRLRQSGSVPVSIQHKGRPTLHFQQETRPLDEFIRHYGGALLDLVVPPENRRQRAIVQEVQRHPCTHQILQVTFQLIGHDDLLKTHVSLVFQGEPSDIRTSGTMVQHQLDRLEIECNPEDLPDRITVDIASLRLGDVVRVSNLPADSRYRILTSSDTVLASLTSTRAGVSSEEKTEDAPDIE